MVCFGVTPFAVAKMWEKPANDGPGSAILSPNPLHKLLAKLSEDFYRQQLYPRKPLEILQSTFMPNIHNSLKWYNISSKIISSSTKDAKIVSLLGWCREVLLDSATRSFFGNRLLEIELNLFQGSFDFDDNSWKLTYKIPRVFSREMYEAKQKSTDALIKYFKLPIKERPGAAWVVQNLETEMRQLGIQEPDIAAFVLMLYWVYVEILCPVGSLQLKGKHDRMYTWPMSCTTGRSSQNYARRSLLWFAKVPPT